MKEKACDKDSPCFFNDYMSVGESKYSISLFYLQQNKKELQAAENNV